MNKKVIASLRNVFDGLMIFMLFVGTTVYALPSNGVTYDNSTSGSSATNVGDAIDDLYSKLSIKDNEINRLKSVGNAIPNAILGGYTALVQGSTVTGSIPSKGATTYTPGTQDQTILAGQYLSGHQTIKGDANLAPQNIAKGKSIFGVNGTYTSDANAASGHILSGRTAYVNGSKITGTIIDRGLAQSGSWGCGSDGCGSGNDAYYAINSLPEGWYHSDGNTWAPEARVNANTLRTQLGVSANKIVAGQRIAGVTGTYAPTPSAMKFNTSINGATQMSTKTTDSGAMSNHSKYQISYFFLEHSHTSGATATHRIQVSTNNSTWTDIKNETRSVASNSYMASYNTTFTYNANKGQTYYFRAVTSYSSGTFLAGASFTVVGADN